MDYYCNDCKMVIREEDVDTEENYVGEYMGQPAYETYLICPCCGESVDEFYGDAGDMDEYEGVDEDVVNYMKPRWRDD